MICKVVFKAFNPHSVGEQYVIDLPDRYIGLRELKHVRENNDLLDEAFEDHGHKPPLDMMHFSGVCHGEQRETVTALVMDEAVADGLGVFNVSSVVFVEVPPRSLERFIEYVWDWDPCKGKEGLWTRFIQVQNKEILKRWIDDGLRDRWDPNAPMGVYDLSNPPKNPPPEDRSPIARSLTDA